MPRKVAIAAAMLCVLAAALALRLPRLGDRPFHGDEAVHAAKFREVWEHGRYTYDPDEYHGPTLYYAALPVMAARGRASFAETQEADYRLPMAMLGAAMVLLFFLLRDGLGTAGAGWAALFAAVSAPFVFYSRYFIQETALVACTLACIGCGWRFRVSGRTAWLYGAAVSAGLMIATKETAVLTFAALGLGVLAARRGDGTKEYCSRRMLHRAGAVLVMLAVAFVFLSGFLSNVQGPLGYLESFAPWLRRAGGTELHRHPWSYYLSLLAWAKPKGSEPWTEALILGLAAVGAGSAIRRGGFVRASELAPTEGQATIRTDTRNEPPAEAAGTKVPGRASKLAPTVGQARRRGLRALKVEPGAGQPSHARELQVEPVMTRAGEADPGFVRFTVVWSLALCTVYCLIPYKTPWNLLSFYLGFVMLAGLGASVLVSFFRSRAAKVAVTGLILAGAGQLAWQSQRTTFGYRDDQTGPYAYAQPMQGVRGIEQRVRELAEFSPDKSRTVTQVVFRDPYYWPLPWYLRRLERVGYWTGGVPSEADARLTGTPIILSSAELDEELTARLNASHFMIGFWSLRPGVHVQMWVKNELWEPFVMRRTRVSRQGEGIE